MVDKKKENWMYMSIVAILGLFAFMLLFSMLSAEPSKANLSIGSIISDDELSDDELVELTGMGCNEIKGLVGTSKDACIYFEDADGKVITVSGKTGFGCEGLVLDGQRLCSVG